jgi:hypothetical protein
MIPLPYVKNEGFAASISKPGYYRRISITPVRSIFKSQYF